MKVLDKNSQPILLCSEMQLVDAMGLLIAAE